MRTFNIVALSLALAFTATAGVCILAERLLGPDAGAFTIIPAFLIGFNSRRIVEKLLGYTLKESYQKDKNEN